MDGLCANQSGLNNASKSTRPAPSSPPGCHLGLGLAHRAVHRPGDGGLTVAHKVTVTVVDCWAIFRGRGAAHLAAASSRCPAGGAEQWEAAGSCTGNPREVDDPKSFRSQTAVPDVGR